MQIHIVLVIYEDIPANPILDYEMQIEKSVTANPSSVERFYHVSICILFDVWIFTIWFYFLIVFATAFTCIHHLLKAPLASFGRLFGSIAYLPGSAVRYLAAQ